MGGGGYFVDVKQLLLNLFGLKHQYCLGNWYIYFYAYAFLILPLLKRWLQSGGVWRFVAAQSVFAVLTKLCGSNEYLYNCFIYSEMLAIGLFCAKTQILSQWSEKVRSGYLWIALVVFAIVLRCGISGAMGFTTDVVAVPLLIIAMCGIFQGHEQSSFSRSLTVLGKNSTYMWFVHCLFFSTATRHMFQSLPVWPNSLLLLFFAVTLVSFVLALALSKVETIHKFKNIEQDR